MYAWCWCYLNLLMTIKVSRQLRLSIFNTKHIQHNNSLHKDVCYFGTCINNINVQLYMLLQHTRNDLYIDNDHEIRPRLLIINRVRVIDSINISYVLVNLIVHLILRKINLSETTNICIIHFLRYIKAYSYFYLLFQYPFTLWKFISIQKAVKETIIKNWPCGHNGLDFIIW